jgi:hypothetical protein
MHFSGSIAVFVALATAATAQTNYATICTEANMQGSCTSIEGGNGQCGMCSIIEGYLLGFEQIS